MVYSHCGYYSYYYKLFLFGLTIIYLSCTSFWSTPLSLHFSLQYWRHSTGKYHFFIIFIIFIFSLFSLFLFFSLLLFFHYFYYFHFFIIFIIFNMYSCYYRTELWLFEWYTWATYGRGTLHTNWIERDGTSLAWYIYSLYSTCLWSFTITLYYSQFLIIFSQYGTLF